VHVTFPFEHGNYSLLACVAISQRARGEPRARASPLVETELSEQKDEL
jgi:hypothetical protein